jgi:hypothetical protein
MLHLRPARSTTSPHRARWRLVGKRRFSGRLGAQAGKGPLAMLQDYIKTIAGRLNDGLMTLFVY